MGAPVQLALYYVSNTEDSVPVEKCGSVSDSGAQTTGNISIVQTHRDASEVGLAKMGDFDNPEKGVCIIHYCVHVLSDTFVFLLCKFCLYSSSKN